MTSANLTPGLKQVVREKGKPVIKAGATASREFPPQHQYFANLQCYTHPSFPAS